MTSMVTTVSCILFGGVALGMGLYGLWQHHESQKLCVNLDRAYDSLHKAQDERDKLKTQYDKAVSIYEAAAKASREEMENLRHSLANQQTVLNRRDELVNKLSQKNQELTDQLIESEQQLKEARALADTQRRKLTEINNIFSYDGTEAGQVVVDDAAEPAD